MSSLSASPDLTAFLQALPEVRDQKSGVFQLANSGLRNPQRIDRLPLVVAIADLAGSLQGYALSLAGLRRQVDPHWKRGMRFLRIGLAAVQMAVADATARLMDWLLIPIQELEPCVPSRKARRRQVRAWFQGLLQVCPRRPSSQSLTEFSWKHLAPNSCQRHRSRPQRTPLT